MKPSDWDRVAPGWERHRERTQQASLPVSERMVALLDPEPGWTVLELAAGPGDTGFLAAPRVARLISTDYSQGMVEVAGRFAEELGLANVEVRVMDAARIELPDASVDGILCRYGYMLFDDPVAALAEARRVLRPGGRLCFAVWGDPPRNPWATTLGRLLLERGHVQPAGPDEPGMFALADPERIAAAVGAAGYGAHVVEEVGIRTRYADVDDFLATILDMAPTTSAVVAGLPEEERASLREELAGRLEPFRGDGGLVVPGLALVAAAS